MFTPTKTPSKKHQTATSAQKTPTTKGRDRSISSPTKVTSPKNNGNSSNVSQTPATPTNQPIKTRTATPFTSPSKNNRDKHYSSPPALSPHKMKQNLVEQNIAAIKKKIDSKEYCYELSTTELNSSKIQWKDWVSFLTDHAPNLVQALQEEFGTPQTLGDMVMMIHKQNNAYTDFLKDYIVQPIQNIGKNNPELVHLAKLFRDTRASFAPQLKTLDCNTTEYTLDFIKNVLLEAARTPKNTDFVDQLQTSLLRKSNFELVDETLQNFENFLIARATNLTRANRNDAENSSAQLMSPQVQTKVSTITQVQQAFVSDLKNTDESAQLKKDGTLTTQFFRDDTYPSRKSIKDFCTEHLKGLISTIVSNFKNYQGTESKAEQILIGFTIALQKSDASALQVAKLFYNLYQSIQAETNPTQALPTETQTTFFAGFVMRGVAELVTDVMLDEYKFNAFEVQTIQANLLNTVTSVNLAESPPSAATQLFNALIQYGQPAKPVQIPQIELEQLQEQAQNVFKESQEIQDIKAILKKQGFYREKPELLFEALFSALTRAVLKDWQGFIDNMSSAFSKYLALAGVTNLQSNDPSVRTRYIEFLTQVFIPVIVNGEQEKSMNLQVGLQGFVTQPGDANNPTEILLNWMLRFRGLTNYTFANEKDSKPNS